MDKITPVMKSPQGLMGMGTAGGSWPNRPASRRNLLAKLRHEGKSRWIIPLARQSLQNAGIHVVR
jgi:hypothetical protein